MATNSCLSLALLHLALLFVQLGMSGYQIITRVALTGGMSLFTFAVYRGAIGLIFLIPSAFFLERNKRPPLTWALVGHFFLLGLTGVFLSQAFFLKGLSYTSPTFATAIQNSIPAITFIIAVAFGQEKVHIKRLDGHAKVLGTVLCVIGATVMVFYKGLAVIKVEQDGTLNDPSSKMQDSPRPLSNPLRLLIMFSRGGKTFATLKSPFFSTHILKQGQATVLLVASKAHHQNRQEANLRLLQEAYSP